MKKKWEKPALRIIVRNKPEETVLAICKTDTAGGQQGTVDFGCRVSTYCDSCTIQTDS